MSYAETAAVRASGGATRGDASRRPTMLDRLRPQGALNTVLLGLFQWARDYPTSRWLFGLLRLLPIVALGKWVLVFRYDDVQETLGRPADFEVPFGRKMKMLNGGPNFLLGMPDGPAYQRCQQLVMAAFRRADVPEIACMAAGFAQEAIGKARQDAIDEARNAPSGDARKQIKARLDAVPGLLTFVAMRICEKYYGVPIADKDEADFAAWTMCMSGFLFGPPTPDPHGERLAEEAGELVRPVIDCAILNTRAALRARRDRGEDVTPATVLERLICMQEEKGNEDLTDDIVRSYLIGMITGFVPTSTIATGNMLEMLLRRRDFMERARAAARAGDDDLLKRCLLEALRFKPINPGPFRFCSDTVIAAGTPRATAVRKDQFLFASTQSAMLDGTRVKDPHVFDPGRPAHDYMVFGYGLHWCIGAFIAQTHATQTFKALLLQPGLERVAGPPGRLDAIGVFPVHLEVQFDA